MTAQIKVTRKSYVRKDGTMVKGSTYLTKDTGKPGKTPEREKFYHPRTPQTHAASRSDFLRRGHAGSPGISS